MKRRDIIDHIIDKTLKEIDAGFVEAKRKVRKIETNIEEFQELTDVLMDMITNYRLYPYKTGDKKDPRYYLMKNENECVVPVEIPKWLYDFISKGGN